MTPVGCCGRIQPLLAVTASYRIRAMSVARDGGLGVDEVASILGH
jgi:hypothetical protein